MSHPCLQIRLLHPFLKPSPIPSPTKWTHHKENNKQKQSRSEVLDKKAKEQSECALVIMIKTSFITSGGRRHIWCPRLKFFWIPRLLLHLFFWFMHIFFPATQVWWLGQKREIIKRFAIFVTYLKWIRDKVMHLKINKTTQYGQYSPPVQIKMRNCYL